MPRRRPPEMGAGRGGVSAFPAGATLAVPGSLIAGVTVANSLSWAAPGGIRTP